MNNSKTAENIFSIILQILFLIVIVMAFDFNPKARSFPLIFGTFSFVMLFLQFIVRNMKNPPKFLQFINKKGALGSSFSSGPEEVLPWKHVFSVFAWLIGYVIVMSQIHYILATLLFLLLFLHFFGKVKIASNLLFSFFFSGSMYLLFIFILESQ